MAYARSIGENAGLVGWGSALWARVAARNPSEIFAVAVYEPGAGEVMRPETGKRIGETFGRVGEHVAEGRIDEAARAFIENCDVIYSHEEIASGAPADFWSSAAERLPLFLQESKQASVSGHTKRDGGKSYEHSKRNGKRHFKRWNEDCVQNHG